MKVEDAWQAVGGLSEPGKMPGYAFGIPVEACKLGRKLARKPGTVCHDCYAGRRRYVWPDTLRAHRRRLRHLKNPRWVEGMVRLLDTERWFRWFDVGDLQGLWHLRLIVRVAELTPWCKHWMPTREVSTVRAFLRSGGQFPANLVVRLSGTWIDGPPPATSGILEDVRTSTVHKAGAPVGYACPAMAPQPGRPGKHYAPSCDLCRACWDPAVKNVSYVWHD